MGRAGFEPAKVSQRIYSPSHLATLVSPLNSLKTFRRHVIYLLRFKKEVQNYKDILLNQTLLKKDIKKININLK